MADPIERSPVSVGTSDSLGKAVVTFDIPELKVDSFLGWLRSGKPTNADDAITFGNRSFHFQLTINAKKTIRYKYTVKKLPGEIIPHKCEKKFYNKRVVLNLVKEKEESWEASLSSTGLDLEY